MNILTIGDLHGHKDWKKSDPEEQDLIIFLGDYIDSFRLSDRQILKNLEEIIAYKTAYPEKIQLLLGNHEISYLYRQYGASGYRYAIGEKVSKILNANSGLFRIAFQLKNYLWTHAGIEAGYYERSIRPFEDAKDENLAASLERLFREMHTPIFEVGPERGGADGSAVGGPFWLHSNRLVKNPLPAYHQIVGHTPVKTIQHFQHYANYIDTSVTLCDCIEWGDGRFYELNIVSDEHLGL